MRRASHLPAGIAICPVCTNLHLLRPRCWFCRGLGLVSRARRNRFKLGEGQR